MATVTDTPVVSTFSIVARDPETGDLGIAVQSKFFGVGAVVPWARANVGAVATQALANVTFGPRGLALLQAGWTAQAVVNYLVASDPDHERRQFGVVDRFGNAANYTGSDCNAWAGGQVGAGFCVQGNILVSQDTTDAMAHAFSTATGEFASRLIDALEAGQVAGGDSRGQQSAAVLVVRERAGYGGGSDRLLNLQVEDHETPIAELRRLYNLHGVFFRPDDNELVPLDETVLDRVRSGLVALGYLQSSEANDRAAVFGALDTWAGKENLEERLRHDDEIDSVVLYILEDQASRTGR
jgi:uncharacterized Ntn-hydrolase superfamily protein